MKNTTAKFMCIILSVALLLTALPLTVFAVDNSVMTADTAKALNDICKAINEGSGGEYTINLTGDILNTNTENDEYGQISITNKDAVVTVIGNGHTLYNPATSVYVSDGAKVILGNGESELILTGNNSSINGVTNDSPGLIYILPGSTCEMNDKVTVKDRNGQNYLGAGATVQGGTFIMNGGTIQNCSIEGVPESNLDGGSVCYGGGVAVFAGGYFEMNNDSTITECCVKSNYTDELDRSHITALGGGVFVSGGSVFKMNGGTISKCSSTNYGGGVALAISKNERSIYKSGNLKSKAIISGTITGNTAVGGAGVFASGNYFADIQAIAIDATINGTSGNETTDTPAAHITTPSDPGLYIDGGAITDNNATGIYDNDLPIGLGGGILVTSMKPTVQIHNTTITSNSADCGAGIASHSYWIQADINGCTITQNTAKSNGGGVYLANIIHKEDNQPPVIPTPTIKNTTITGNKSGDRGAGVYYNADSELHISGKDIIQDNTFNGKLNNLNVLIGKQSIASYSETEKLMPVYVDGDLTGSQIGLSDPTLWDDSKTDDDPAAASSELLTSGYKEHNPEVHPSEYFTSDHETWIVDRSVKTVIEEPDEASAYRVYEVERHPLKDNITPKVYAGNKGQYIILKTQNDTSGITDANTLFTALRNYYSDSEYYDVNPNYNYSNDVKFLPKDSNAPLSYIQLKKNNYGDITVTYSTAIPKRQYGGRIDCSASTTIQKYAKPGELVLQITLDGSSWLTKYYELGNLVFSDNSTTETIDYVNADPPGNVLYEYDEYGDIKAKLITGSFKTKYTRTTTIETGTEDEVRLVRKNTVDYHINNEEIDDKYGNDDIFTDEIKAAGTTVNVGDNITKFFTVPEISPSQTDSCPYIFKGWYYDKDNENDKRPVKFETDKYIGGKDIYAHWITVNDVDMDAADENLLKNGSSKYGGFDLAGVQIRHAMPDYNFNEFMPGGMRFITSLSMDVVNKIKALQPGDNIEYGYVATTDPVWIEYHKATEGRKLLYVSDSADVNGIITDGNQAADDNYFGFAKNIVCTSQRINAGGVVKRDHQNYKDYLLYSLVITYDGAEGKKDTDVLARPYIKYTDANNLVRVAYSEYKGNSNTLGGCCTNFNAINK